MIDHKIAAKLSFSSYTNTMVETLRALLVDPLLRIRIFSCNVGIYANYPTLFGVDCLLYFFRVFYFTSRIFLREDDELTYGESVYGSLKTLFTPYINESHKTFCDIGSGLGKVVFFSDRVLGLNSVGIECNSTLVRVSNFLAKGLFFKRSSFLVQDFKTSMPKADIYLSPNTCLRTDSLAILGGELNCSKPGTLIFSISTPLPIKNADIIGEHLVLFSWGKATVYVQRVCDTL